MYRPSPALRLSHLRGSRARPLHAPSPLGSGSPPAGPLALERGPGGSSKSVALGSQPAGGVHLCFSAPRPPFQQPPAAPARRPRPKHADPEPPVAGRRKGPDAARAVTDPDAPVAAEGSSRPRPRAPAPGEDPARARGRPSESPSADIPPRGPVGVRRPRAPRLGSPQARTPSAALLLPPPDAPPPNPGVLAASHSRPRAAPAKLRGGASPLGRQGRR